MKYLYLIAMCFVLVSCAPKAVTSSYPSPFKFEMVDSVQGNKSDLYVKAYQWMAKTFNSANAVIQMNDKEAGKLIGKGNFAYTRSGFMFVSNDYINYTLSIDVKDNKYRIILSDFNHEGGYGTQKGKAPSAGSLDNIHAPYPFSLNAWNDIKRDAKNKSEDLIASLKQAMHSNTDNF